MNTQVVATVRPSVVLLSNFILDTPSIMEDHAEALMKSSNKLKWPTAECHGCGHKWQIRTPKPKRCPHCTRRNQITVKGV